MAGVPVPGLDLSLSHDGDFVAAVVWRSLAESERETEQG